MIIKFDKFLNENKEIKINIKSGINQIVSAYRGSAYSPEEWRIESGGQLGMGIYFSTSYSKAYEYGDIYLGEIELINPVISEENITFEQIEDIFYKSLKMPITEIHKFINFCNNKIFFNESRSWSEIGEDIGRCTNLKYRNLLFKQLSNYTNSICIDDGFEICLLNKKNILKIKKL